jgi:hypothetical protein
MPEFTQTDPKSLEQINAEILSRFSVLDLIEMNDQDIQKGEFKLSKIEKPPQTVESGTNDYVRWWTVESNGATYHVRRFENFVWCSCPDFFYARTGDENSRKATLCKHLAITLRFYCKRCRKREVEYGRLCQQCDMDTSPLLKTEVVRKPAEFCGSIRIN